MNELSEVVKSADEMLIIARKAITKINNMTGPYEHGSISDEVWKVTEEVLELIGGRLE